MHFLLTSVKLLDYLVAFWDSSHGFFSHMDLSAFCFLKNDSELVYILAGAHSVKFRISGSCDQSSTYASPKWKLSTDINWEIKLSISAYIYMAHLFTVFIFVHMTQHITMQFPCVSDFSEAQRWLQHLLAYSCLMCLFQYELTNQLFLRYSFIGDHYDVKKCLDIWFLSKLANKCPPVVLAGSL